MRIRNFVFAATALATLLAGPTNVQAASMNEYDELQATLGLFESSGGVTAVGLTSNAAGTVYWAFFDPNGNGLVSGSFSVQQDRLTPFIWDSSTAGGPALADVPGLLLFGLDTDGNGRIEVVDGKHLGSNAFFVDISVNDVAYIPTMNLRADDIDESNPSNWTNLPIAMLDGAGGKDADTGDVMDMQYLIDGAAGGDDTNIFIFTTEPVASSQTMTIYDGAGASKSITVPFLFNHLNVIDPEQLTDVTSAFNGGGFIRWTVPSSTTATAVDVFGGIIVESPTFGAAQTLLPNFTE